jgi:DNA repair protein RecN (Recombination protein N)
MQLELLDRYGGLMEESKSFVFSLNRYRTLNRDLERLQSEETDRARKIDFIKFQIEEIRSTDILPNEEEDLHKEKQLLLSTELRVQTAHGVKHILDSSDSEDSGDSDESRMNGVLNPLRVGLQKMRSLLSLDEQVRPIVDSLERALIETEEVLHSLDRYIHSIELNPERLEEVQERLSILSDLRRKYGGTLSAVLQTLALLEVEVAAMGQDHQKLEHLSKELLIFQEDLKKKSQTLSKARKSVAEALALSVTGELKDLKMGEAKFLIELSTRECISEWGASGPDQIQFVVQTNRGEAARPLGKIASGGELSRLMLAIRRVISDRGGIGVYLFDEIDAGIGGQTAFQVGKKLKSVARFNQVICITHLPQVASFADHHLSVSKVVHGKRTLTEVKELSDLDQEEELARMLGGPELTKKSLENASELLESARTS